MRKIERERRWILRIQSCKGVVRGGTHRGEIYAIVAAAFRRQTFQSAGRGEICGLNRTGGAAEEAGRRCLDSFVVTLRAELWIVSAANGEQIVLGNLYVIARVLDVFVVL